MPLRASTRFVLALVLVPLLAGSQPGCTDATAPSLAVQLVAPDGGDPTVGTDIDTLTVHVRQGDGPVMDLTSGVDPVDLDVAIDDLTAPIELTVELTGPTDRLIGAPPVFVPLESGTLRIVVGPPGSCAELTGDRAALATPRASAGVVDEDTFALVAGGFEVSGASGRVEAFDLVRMQRAAEIADLPSLAGASRAAPVGDGKVLVVSDQAAPVLYDLRNPDQRLVPVTLHAGADATSAVVALPDGGAVVLGGGGDAPVDGVTWVASDGTTHAARLAVPRARAAATAFGDLVLVAGGMADGDPLVELIGPADTMGRVVAAEPTHGVRDGALLAERGGRAWLLGGTDALGDVRTDTLLLSGCPDACAVAPGPTWPDARVGVAALPIDAGLLLVGGGDAGAPGALVERARLDTALPTFEPAPPLAVPRSQAGVVRFASGVTVVLGGRAAGGVTGSVEVCWPDGF